jgi:hypothetical protein
MVGDEKRRGDIVGQRLGARKAAADKSGSLASSGFSACRMTSTQAGANDMTGPLFLFA